MAATTIGQIEVLEWELQRFNPQRSPALAGGTLSLPAAIELNEVLRHYRNVDLDELVRLQFARCPVWNLMGLYCGGRRRVSNGATVLTRIPEKYDENWLTVEMQSFRNVLLSRRFPQVLSASFTSAVFEIVDNVWQHCESKEPAIFAYSVVDRGFTFCVSDSGVGVLASLKRNRKYSYLSTSLEALEEAIKPNVSRLPNGRGLGFDQLLRSLSNFWGQTRLRSGQAVLRFNREQASPMRCHYFVPELPGLQVFGVCRLSPGKG